MIKITNIKDGSKESFLSYQQDIFDKNLFTFENEGVFKTLIENIDFVFGGLLFIQIGVPGSGKTFLGNEMSKTGSFFIDDISVCGIKILESAIKNHENIVIADVFLCEERQRFAALNKLNKLGIKSENINWVFFENSPEKCLKNVISNTEQGSIIVFHDSKKAEINLKFALPKAIQILKNKGFVFDVIS